jgi:hypothetical protein
MRCDADDVLLHVVGGSGQVASGVYTLTSAILMLSSTSDELDLERTGLLSLNRAKKHCAIV